MNVVSTFSSTYMQECKEAIYLKKKKKLEKKNHEMVKNSEINNVKHIIQISSGNLVAGSPS